MMRTVEWKELAGQKGPPQQVALTIGTFDSLHIGHQRLIRGVVENRYGAIAAVCTFAQNPAKVLGNRPFTGSILTLPQKIEKLERLGIALVVLIDFSPEISKLSGKSFLALLAERLEVKKLVVGYDFHMGRGRDTNPQELVGILNGSATELEIVPATQFGTETVSSSRIRRLVAQGRFVEAREMLQDDFRLDLRGIAPRPADDFSLIRASDIEQVIPRAGTYRVRFTNDKLDIPGTVNIEEQRLTWQTEFAGKVQEIRFIERE